MILQAHPRYSSLVIFFLRIRSHGIHHHCHGTCQTGSSWTTWINNLPRKYDFNCHYGISLAGKSVLPVAGYKPFLLERDIQIEGLNSVTWCGRTPSEELLTKGAVLSDFKGHFADVCSVRVILEFLTEEPRQCLDIPAPLLFLLSFMLWRHPEVAVEECSRGIRMFLSTQHPCTSSTSTTESCRKLQGTTTILAESVPESRK